MGLTHSTSNFVFRWDLNSSRAARELPDSSVSTGCSVTAPAEQNREGFFRVGLEILDLLNVGLVICDSTCRLLQANQSAQRMLHANDGLRTDGSGRLRTSKPSSPALPDVVRELIEMNGEACGETSHIVIAAPRLSKGRPLIAFVLNPVLLSAVRGLVPVVPIAFWEHEVRCNSQQLLMETGWGLTPAECRFANLLMEGLSLVECCERLAICRATGAFHLKNLFRKTGARRQIELLSILFREVGARSVGQRSLSSGFASYSPIVGMKHTRDRTDERGFLS
jgi:DNA-binding CsgD family transcriptional regulator